MFLAQQLGGMNLVMVLLWIQISFECYVGIQYQIWEKIGFMYRND